MKNNKGFTLVELLAVIVILAIILAISIPAITKIVDSSKKAAFAESNKMVIRAVMLKASSDDTFNYASITAQNASEKLNIALDGFQTLTISKYGGSYYVISTGKDNFNGYTSYGTKDSLTVEKTQDAQIALPVPTTSTTDTCFTFVSGTITDYSDSCTRDVVIPGTINEVAVTAIGDNAFVSTLPITSVYIPYGITSIGDNAFLNNNISSLFIPGSVKLIEMGAFAGVPLTSLVLSEGLETIGNSVFNGSTLDSLVLPTTITSLGCGMFNSIKNFTMLENTISSNYCPYINGSVDNAILPGTFKTISGGFLAGKGLKTLILNEGIETISSGAFSGNLLTTLDIPSSMRTIDGGAFGSNKLTTVNFANGIITIDGGAFSNNLITSLTIPASVKTIDDGAFGSNKIGSIIVPSTVTTLGWGAFETNLLTSITMQGSSTVVDPDVIDENNYAFQEAYIAGGAGTYIGTQTGTTWIKQQN